MRAKTSRMMSQLKKEAESNKEKMDSQNKKIMELDQKIDQQNEVIQQQNVMIAEQMEKLSEMNRRMIERGLLPITEPVNKNQTVKFRVEKTSRKRSMESSSETDCKKYKLDDK